MPKRLENSVSLLWKSSSVQSDLHKHWDGPKKVFLAMVELNLTSYWPHRVP